MNRIWSRLNITFNVEDIDQARSSHSEFRSVLKENLAIVKTNEEFVSGQINGYFARTIGLNGIAFSLQGFFVVADITTVNDYLATAHELSHLLGLQHSDNRQFLMFQGSNGEILGKREIDIVMQNG